MGISMAIWANHNLRASITAMENITKRIYEDEAILRAEKEVAPLEKVFALQGAAELAAAEAKYLPQTTSETKSIILVREPNTENLIQQQIEQMNEAGIKNIQMIDSGKLKAGNSCEAGQELALLYQAKAELKDPAIISCSDIFYKPYLIHELLSDPSDLVLLADADSIKGDNKYFVSGNEAYSRMHVVNSVAMKQFSKQISPSDIHGEFIGLWKVSAKGAEIVRKTLELLSEKEDFSQLTLEDLFTSIMESHPITIKYIKGQWLDLDEYEKLAQLGDERC
jgi:phosphoenolpyruvate phosphomutase